MEVCIQAGIVQAAVAPHPRELRITAEVVAHELIAALYGVLVPDRSVRQLVVAEESVEAGHSLRSPSTEQRSLGQLADGDERDRQLLAGAMSGERGTGDTRRLSSDVGVNNDAHATSDRRDV